MNPDYREGAPTTLLIRSINFNFVVKGKGSYRVEGKVEVKENREQWKGLISRKTSKNNI